MKPLKKPSSCSETLNTALTIVPRAALTRRLSASAVAIERMVRAQTRLLIACSGLGHVQRGFETFARECFEALRGEPGLDVHLATAPALRRDGRAARLVGQAL